MEREKKHRRGKVTSYDHVNWRGLRDLRITAKLTQKQIADRAKITQSYYSKIELGDVRSPDDIVIGLIAAAFETTTSDLLSVLPRKDPSKAAEAVPQAPTLRYIPKYNKSGKPKGFDFDDGVLMDSSDLTIAPPIVQNVPNAYAVVMPTSDMEPKFREGDVLYVDPELSPFYGDDVVIKLSYGERTILLVRELCNMERMYGMAEDDEPLAGYGVLTASEIHKLKLQNARDGGDEDDEWELGYNNAKWFILYPEYIRPPEEVILDEGEDNMGHPFAINVDVIVARDRYRFIGEKGKLKEQSERNPVGIACL